MKARNPPPTGERPGSIQMFRGAGPVERPKDVSPSPESAVCGPSQSPPGDDRRPRSAGSPPTRHVGGDRGPGAEGSRSRRSRLPPVGSRPDSHRPARRLHRRPSRGSSRQRLRLVDGGPTASALERDDGRVPPVDVHREGSSRRRPRDADRAGRHAVDEGPRDSGDAVARIAIRRADLHARRLPADHRNAAIPRPTASKVPPQIAARLPMISSGESTQAFIYDLDL